MRITVPFQYTENEIPPRCRKPRPVSHKAHELVSIKEIESSQAPLAIIEHGLAWNKDGERVPKIKEFRWFDKKLWLKKVCQDASHGPDYIQTKTAFLTDGIEGIYSDNSYLYYARHESKEEVVKKIRQWARNILFIDGVRWVLASEPRYVVITFGLGHNHASTALMTDHRYNDNIPASSYWRIDQRAEAIKTAEQTALRRGDTKSLPIDPHADFEILIPEAVRLNPKKEHGNGCEFLNKTEKLIENTSTPIEAAFGLIALAARR